MIKNYKCYYFKIKSVIKAADCLKIPFRGAKRSFINLN